MSFRQKQNGDHMEYLVAAMFQGEGYFVRRSTSLSSSIEPTDIDILGIKLTRPFQLHRIICDCKDKARSKPYERIFWTKGLGEFVNATEVYVALPHAKREIIEFAKIGQVRILTQDITEESCSRLYKSTNSSPFGLANESFYSKFFSRLEKYYRKDKDADSLFVRSQSLFLANDPYVALNNALQDLKLCASKLHTLTKKDELFEIWRFITGNYVVLTSYLLLCICADTVALPKELRNQVITERLTYGNLDPEKVQQFLKLMNKLALELAKAAVPASNRKDVITHTIDGLPSPYYAKDVAGLVERALENPEIYINLPRYLDYLIFELVVQERQIKMSEWVSLFGKFETFTALKASRNVLVFISSHLKFDLLKLLYPKQEKEEDSVIQERKATTEQKYSENQLNSNQSSQTQECEPDSTSDFLRRKNEKKMRLLKLALESNFLLPEYLEIPESESLIEELIQSGYFEKSDALVKLTENGRFFAERLDLSC